jgi:subtilisin family serine protease
MHVDFRGKLVDQLDFTANTDLPVSGAPDTSGHGTKVSGIIAARGNHIGVAPGSNLVVLKVFGLSTNSWAPTIKALQWVDAHAKALGICAVNMSLGDDLHWKSPDELRANSEAEAYHQIASMIRKISAGGVAVVAAAGNNYYEKQVEAMSFPAILPEAISVGAVYGNKVKPVPFIGGAISNRAELDMIAPFSERMMMPLNLLQGTTIFAPGTFVITTGVTGTDGDSVDTGTSDATPFVTGVVALLHDFYVKRQGNPEGFSIARVKSWLRVGQTRNDKDTRQDNVRHTGKDFLRLDAMCSLAAEAAELSSPPSAVPHCP